LQLQPFVKKKKELSSTTYHFLALKSPSMQLTAVSKTPHVIKDGGVRSIVIGLNGKWKELMTNNCCVPYSS
jgi:hypothetical protein